MTMTKLCENPTTKWLRDQYKAFPVETPEERLKPMILLEQNKNTFNPLGDFMELIESGELNLPIKDSIVADASLSKTKAMDISVGMGILNGFFRALNMEGAKISAAFSNVKEIALSFTGVTRYYIDIMSLGRQWKYLEFDVDNPVLQLIRTDKKSRLLLLTDAITSSDFTIMDMRKRDTDLGIDIPLIERYIADLNLNVKLESDRNSSVTFKGEKPLTFAMSCMLLGFDKEGKLQFEKINAAKGTPDTETDMDYKMILDEDVFEPTMLKIGNR